MDRPGDGVGSRGLADLLARRLAESGQGRGSDVTVAELHRMLIPYQACRDVLGFATKAEYDVALLHLLQEQEVVRIQEEELAEKVERELASPEPGLAFLKNFAASTLEVLGASEGDAAGEEPAVTEEGAQATAAGVAEAGVAEAGEAEAGEAEAGEAEAGVAEAGEAEAGEAEAGAETGATGEEEAETAAPATPRPAGDDWLAALEEEVRPEAAVARLCWQCAEPLPARPGIRYCPECGTDQKALRCRKCGEALEPGWGFCPRCGGPAKVD